MPASSYWLWSTRLKDTGVKKILLIVILFLILFYSVLSGVPFFVLAYLLVPFERLHVTIGLLAGLLVIIMLVLVLVRSCSQNWHRLNIKQRWVCLGVIVIGITVAAVTIVPWGITYGYGLKARIAGNAEVPVVRAWLAEQSISLGHELPVSRASAPAGISRLSPDTIWITGQRGGAVGRFVFDLGEFAHFDLIIGPEEMASPSTEEFVHVFLLGSGAYLVLKEH